MARRLLTGFLAGGLAGAAIIAGVFLVLAHVAMIFGMLDPTVLGFGATHVMPGGGTMPGMNH